MFRWLRRRRDRGLTIEILADAQEALDALAEIKATIADLPEDTITLNINGDSVRKAEAELAEIRSSLPWREVKARKHGDQSCYIDGVEQKIRYEIKHKDDGGTGVPA